MTKKDYELAAGIIRNMSRNVSPSTIRPISYGPPAEDIQSRGLRATGIAVWTAREAFVNLFAVSPSFDADRFRAACIYKG